LDFVAQIYWRLAWIGRCTAARCESTDVRARFIAASQVPSAEPRYAASGGAARWCSASAQELTINT